MMTTPLSDALGPRARRRALIASVVSGVVLLVFIVIALRRFADNDQFDADKWRPLTDTGTIRFLLGGLANTLKAAAVSMVLATLLGAILALGRLAPNVIVRNAAGAYVELFRGAPLLLMMFFSAMQGVYVAALYRYATEGEAVSGFDRSTLASAFVEKRN